MTMAMVTPLCRDTRTHGLVLVRSLSGVLPCGTPMPGSVATSCSVTTGYAIGAFAETHSSLSPERLNGMTLRTASVILFLLDAAVWALVAFAMFNSGSDPATQGLDE